MRTPLICTIPTLISIICVVKSMTDADTDTRGPPAEHDSPPSMALALALALASSLTLAVAAGGDDC